MYINYVSKSMPLSCCTYSNYVYIDSMNSPTSVAESEIFSRGYMLNVSLYSSILNFLNINVYGFILEYMCVCVCVCVCVLKRVTFIFL